MSVVAALSALGGPANKNDRGRAKAITALTARPGKAASEFAAI